MWNTRKILLQHLSNCSIYMKLLVSIIGVRSSANFFGRRTRFAGKYMCEKLTKCVLNAGILHDICSRNISPNLGWGGVGGHVTPESG